jgi:tetratricopeptide (TPR) repeat protein
VARLPSSGLSEGEALGFEAAALAGLGRTQDALARCRRRLEIQPHLPAAVWQLAELEVASDGLEAALERYRRMARIPSLPPVYREVHASLARRAGRTEEAIRAYDSIGDSGGSRVQRQRAFTLAKSGRDSEAIPLLEELLRQDPRDRYLHSSYGAACRRAGEIERAINFYNALLGLHPEEKGIYGRLSRLRRALEGQA